jgi:tetratricopeptide (TPR) repeat protein
VWGYRLLAADQAVHDMMVAKRHEAWEEVRAAAARAQRLNPYRPEPPLALGLAALELGDGRAAIPPLAALVSRYPYRLPALGNLATAHARVGEWGLAVSFYKRMLALVPEDAETHYRAAVALERQGDRRSARDEFVRAAERDPRRATYALRAGIASLYLGESETALSWLTLALAVDPGSALAHKAVGVLLIERLGRIAEGREHVRRALEIDPGLPDAARLRTLLGDGGQGP